MITIGTGSVRRTAVVRTILFATLLMGAMPGVRGVGYRHEDGDRFVLSRRCHRLYGDPTNAGPGAQADNVGNEFTDPLPGTVALVSASATVGLATALTGPTNAVIWNGSLPIGGSVTITINATVATGTALGTSVGNTGSISFDGNSDGTNESAAVTDDPNLPGASDPTSFTVIPAVTLTRPNRRPARSIAAVSSPTRSS